MRLGWIQDPATFVSRRTAIQVPWGDTPTCNGSIECDTPACNGRIECDTPACNVERLSSAKHITEMAHSINHEISITALWNASLKWYIPTRSWVGKKNPPFNFHVPSQPCQCGRCRKTLACALALQHVWLQQSSKLHRLAATAGLYYQPKTEELGVTVLVLQFPRQSFVVTREAVLIRLLLPLQFIRPAKNRASGHDSCMWRLKLLLGTNQATGCKN